MGGAASTAIKEAGGLYEGKAGDTPRSPTKPRGAGGHYHADPGAAAAGGSGATTAHLKQYYVGDVVEVQDADPEMCLYYEGIITERNHDGSYSVQYPHDELEQFVAGERLRKVSGWDDLFVGDPVRVRDADMPGIQCEGEIAALNADGTYDVTYPVEDGDDELETGVVRENIVKIGTHHLKEGQGWARLRNVVMGISAFAKAGAFKELAAAAKAEEAEAAAEGKDAAATPRVEDATPAATPRVEDETPAATPRVDADEEEAAAAE